MSEEVRPQPAADQNSLFSGLTGWAKQLVSAGIFFMLAWYTFIAAPRERQASMAHGEKAIESVNEANKSVVRDLTGKIDKAFDRLIDKQEIHYKEDAQIQKSILKATKEGGMP